NIPCKADNLKDYECLSGTCPSLERKPEKIVYFPHRGFTFCCGPLVFDAPSHSLFASDYEKIVNLPMYQDFKTCKFSDFLQPTEKSLSFSDRCDVCRYLFANANNEGAKCVRC
ncbi:MAG: hypothetical protein HY537_02990, partial [Deltaproteobacteria bacterium]|nr:hypothetical protein [Deltaproteobacteria bacterium]